MASAGRSSFSTSTRVHGDEVAVRAVSGRRRGADEALHAGVVGQSDCVTGEPLRTAVARAGGQLGHVAGRLATAQCQNPEPVGASGS